MMVANGAEITQRVKFIYLISPKNLYLASVLSLSLDLFTC